MNDNRREPLTVTHLRQQIRRGASSAVLFRIAGSAAEFHRLDGAYRLVETDRQRQSPPSAIPVVTDRQRLLLDMVAVGPLEGEMHPLLERLGRLLGCDGLVVERDLRHLERRFQIRIADQRGRENKLFRTVELFGKRQVAAAPPCGDGTLKNSGVGTVNV